MSDRFIKLFVSTTFTILFSWQANAADPTKVPPEERTVLVASPGRTALSTSTSGVALVSSRQKATSSAITARI